MPAPPAGAPGGGAPGSGNPADLTRATVAGYDANGVPQHINRTSPYVDQNQAYGSNELVGQFLREGDGNGGDEGEAQRGHAERVRRPITHVALTRGAIMRGAIMRGAVEPHRRRARGRA